MSKTRKPTRNRLARHAGQADPSWRPFWRGLVLACPFVEAGGDVIDLVAGRRGTIGSVNTTWAPGAEGPRIKALNANTEAVNFGASNLFVPTVEISIVIKYKYQAFNGTGGFGVNDGTTGRVGTHFPYSDNTVYWDFGNTGRITTAAPVWGDDVWVFTAGPFGMEIWQNGILKSSTASNPGARTGVADAFCIGRHAGNYSTDAETSLFLMYDRRLSSTEIRRISDDPYGLFRRDRVRTGLISVPSGLTNYFDGLWQLEENTDQWQLEDASGSWAGETFVGVTAYTLTADTGVFTLTGNAAATKAGRVVAGATGSFTLTGNAASLEKGYKVQANTGAFALTGNAAGTLVARKVAANTGAFTLTGNAATLAKGRTLAANTGVFVLTGNPAATRATRKVAANTGAFTLTGNAATLLKGRTLVAATGVFVLSGNPAAFRWTHRLAANTGVFSETGSAANLLRGRRLVADAGVYALTGNAAGFLWVHRLSAELGAFVLTGRDADLRLQGINIDLVLVGTSSNSGPRYSGSASGSSSKTLIGTTSNAGPRYRGR